MMTEIDSGQKDALQRKNNIKKTLLVKMAGYLEFPQKNIQLFWH